MIADHQPPNVTASDDADFVVISAEDWEREQETRYVLQDRSLMAQIARSAATHAAGTGHRPPQEQLAEDIGALDRL
jgi:antitoxin YefM